MSPEKFHELARQGYNRIPVDREILADLETPLSTYLKLARGPYSYFLESVQGGEKWGRYSIIGLPCKTLLKVSGDKLTVETDGAITESCETEDPFEFIEAYQQRFKVPELDELPRFNGGLVGYLAYDTVRFVERKVAQSTPPDTVNTPDIILMLSEEVVVLDNLRGKLMLMVYQDPAADKAYESALARLDVLAEKLDEQLHIEKEVSDRVVEEADFVYSFVQEAYESAVNKIKEYIVAGDVMQVVLSQRMSLPYNGEPINVYRALRQLNPSPYMVFMDMGDFNIVISTPEILAGGEAGKITVSPLAGKRQRGKIEEEDLALE